MSTTESNDPSSSSLNDRERLDRAFAALERSGIIARFGYACCASRARHLIEKEFGNTINGYVCSFEEDPDTVDGCDYLCLTFDSGADNPTSSAAIGHAVVQALTRVGLALDWPRSTDRHMFVFGNFAAPSTETSHRAPRDAAPHQNRQPPTLARVHEKASEYFTEGAVDNQCSPRTDRERLDRAFAALARNGIVARHDYTCCTACGINGIWKEFGNTAIINGIWKEFGNTAIKGYVFYHHHDVAELGFLGGLSLSYGSLQDHASTLAIGRSVVDALAHEGLSVTLPPLNEHRIFVHLNPA